MWNSGSVEAGSSNFSGAEIASAASAPGT
jgi:hypothetical protein